MLFSLSSLTINCGNSPLHICSILLSRFNLIIDQSLRPMPSLIVSVIYWYVSLKLSTQPKCLHILMELLFIWFRLLCAFIICHKTINNKNIFRDYLKEYLILTIHCITLVRYAITMLTLLLLLNFLLFLTTSIKEARILYTMSLCSIREY